MIQIYSKQEIEDLIQREVHRQISAVLSEEKFRKIKHVSDELSDIEQIQSLEIDDRVLRTLLNADINTVGELCSMSQHDLLKYRNLGTKSVRHIERVLSFHGRKLARI